MRKLIFKIEITLDGFISGPQKGKMDWADPNIDAEGRWKDVFEMLSTVDTVIMSRVIYQGFKSYWPAEATNPSSPENNKKFANWLNAAPKIVFSKKLKKVDWENAQLAKGGLKKEIEKLKAMPGKDMVMWGGAEFPQALMNLDLIDEYRINVYPTIIGKGKALFDDISKLKKLKLVYSKTFESGIIRLCYQKA